MESSSEAGPATKRSKSVPKPKNANRANSKTPVSANSPTTVESTSHVHTYGEKKPNNPPNSKSNENDDDEDDSHEYSQQTVNNGNDVWDISRINKLWEIDSELRRNLPFLARAKRNDRESAAEKFLRVTKLSVPASPMSEESMLVEMPFEKKASQRHITMTSETKAKYFGSPASQDCYSIFRKLAAQKYLTTTPLHDFLEGQQDPLLPVESENNNHPTTQKLTIPEMVPMLRATAANSTSSCNSLLVTNEFHPVDKEGIFSRQFTARHKFSSLCLEKDLPPCIRLIIRQYFSPEINVSHMAIGDELATVFAACILDLPMVTGLNVRNNRLQDKGLQAIINVVVMKKDLYHIDLSENKVDGEAAASLAGYLGSSTCSLQSMKLSHADVDDNEIAPFVKALHTNRSLQTLDISHNMIGSTENLNVVKPSIITGGEALATMLSINYTLTSLDLSWNYLRLGGAVELGKALAFNSGLRELNLAYNAFGNAGAQAIGEALFSNTCLERLNLSNNNIPSHGALVIASALKNNNQLTKLNMNGNPLGQAGGRALLHAVAACVNRQLSISMEGCNFNLTESDAFDPSESTGSYDLNMEIPYERAIALELLRVANNKQGCKFLSIVHTSTVNKVKRHIKVELRELEGSDARRKLLKTAGILTNAQNDQENTKSYKLDKQSLEDLFHELDQDDSGCLSEQELKQGINLLGLQVRDEDVPRYIARYDLDGTGTIEMDEFVELLASFNFETEQFTRHCVDVETNRPLEIPTEGRLQIEFVDFHVSSDNDNAHSHAGVERLIENISTSKNKSQMLTMAKSGLVFKAQEAQLLLESVSDVYEITQAVILLLPNMVDATNAYTLMEQNLDAHQRLRVQHMMGSALQPMLGISTGHYRIDLSNDLDRLTLKKLMENSNRTSFLRKKSGQKDTSQHMNHHGFRNEVMNAKALVLEPQFLDSAPKFGVLEFDYVQLGRQPARPMSNKRMEQLIRACQLEQMGPSMNSWMPVANKDSKPGTAITASGRRTSTSSSHGEARVSTSSSSTSKKPATASPSLHLKSSFPPVRRYTRALFTEFEAMKTVKNYIKFGDGLNHTIELQPFATGSAGDGEIANNSERRAKSPMEGMDDTTNAFKLDHSDDEDDDESHKPKSMAPTRRNNIKETCTARRLLYNLQWCLATRWLTVQQAIRLLQLWPQAFASARIEFVCTLFDRITDLHNFNGILSALTDHEAAQCLYRLGWLNIWTALMPDNYYELNLALYEEREVAKVLVRLAIDEPGENWQNETFGWTRDEVIPGWELNMSWLKDGGFPEKGHLRLEYYSGADRGCGPVWPTRRELASATLCGLPHEIEDIVLYVDSLSMKARMTYF